MEERGPTSGSPWAEAATQSAAWMRRLITRQRSNLRAWFRNLRWGVQRGRPESIDAGNSNSSVRRRPPVSIGIHRRGCQRGCQSGRAGRACQSGVGCTRRSVGARGRRPLLYGRWQKVTRMASRGSRYGRRATRFLQVGAHRTGHLGSDHGSQRCRRFSVTRRANPTLRCGAATLPPAPTLSRPDGPDGPPARV